MPRRTVKVKFSCDVVLDDEREGIPSTEEMSEAVATAVTQLKGAVGVSNINLSWGLDRKSSEELRRRDRVRRVNSR